MSQQDEDGRQSEQALQESEERFRVLSEAAFEGIVVHDRGTILDANPSFAQMFGYDIQEVIGKEVTDFVTPDARDDMQRAILEGDDVPYESTGLKKDGSTLNIEVHGKELPRSGGKARVKAMRDITERKRAEVEIRAINEELEKYAQVVAHDVRSPLTSAATALKMMEQIRSNPEADGAMGFDELQEVVETNVFNAIDVVDKLYALALAGNAPEQVERVSISQVVQAIIEERSESITAKGIDVRADKDLGEIQADSTQMYQLFGNLIGNAIKHLESEEPVVKIRYLGFDDQGAYRYLVRDNGKGIPEGELPNIFNPFTGGKRGGMGMGLSIVKNIVGVYSGEIAAYNNHGACFEFVIKDFG